MTSEVRTIPGYPRYGVSQDGQVYYQKLSAWLPMHGSRTWNKANPVGYLKVNLAKDGTKKTFPVHTLVALVFIGPRPTGLEINHKDGNHFNNQVENLEYVTPSVNIRHAHHSGLIKVPSGEGHSKTSLTGAQVQELRTMRKQEGIPFHALAEKFGISRRSARDIVNHRTWKLIS